MRRSTVMFGLGAVLACTPSTSPVSEERPGSEKTSPEPNGATATPTPDPVHRPPPKIELRKLDPGSVEIHQGELRDAVGWTDRNGDNAVLFSTDIQEHDAAGEARGALWVVHAVTTDGARRVLRTVKDRVPPCPNDVTLAFEPRALSVTDLDGDQIGEVTFAYWHSCKGDVSPDGLKLLLLEGGDKYIIRGVGHWPHCDPGAAVDDPACKDEHTPGHALSNGPPAFRQHLERVWAEVSAQEI